MTDETRSWSTNLQQGPRVHAEATHKCAELDALEQQRATAEGREMEAALYGAAFTRIDYAEGRWWAHNGEYSNIVQYCPACGQNLESPRSHDGRNEDGGKE